MATTTTSTTAMKLTKIGTDSGDVTPPHPTPATDAASDIASVHDLNLAQVSLTLGTVQEVLNEAAEDALYPHTTPPLNSPVQGFSPAPSIVSGIHRPQNLARRRGLSSLQDRLHQVTLGDRIHHRWATGSVDETQSIPDTFSQTNESEAGGNQEGPSSPTYSTTGTIPVAIGSPSSNPLIGSYAAFDSINTLHLDDMVHSKDSAKEDLDMTMTMTMPTSVTEGSQIPTVQPRREGVHEKSIWADEVMGDLDRALKRLEQLAADEADVAKASGKQAQVKSACTFYLERLQKSLNGDERLHGVIVKETPHASDT